MTDRGRDFPHAIQILDWYRTSNYIWKVAQALYPTEGDARSQWANAQLDVLWQSRTTAVIANLRPLVAACSAARDAVSLSQN